MSSTFSFGVPLCSDDVISNSSVRANEKKYSSLDEEDGQEETDDGDGAFNALDRHAHNGNHNAKNSINNSVSTSSNNTKGKASLEASKWDNGIITLKIII